MFSFGVTVKNRGTSSETFNVILYCNDTTIGEQRIAAMTPTSEKTLSFQWDTSGFAKENVYSIKAITSEIKNDSTPENNIYTLNYVQPQENLAIPIGLGVLGGATWIYLAIGLGGGFTAAGLLVIKKRKPKSPDYEVQNENSKSFQGINDITEGAFPEAYSIMIVGGADSEKSAFCQQLANGYLKQGKPILYISYDQFPEEIRTNMKELGWDISSHEQEGNFTFLDAYSSIGGKPSKEKFFVKQPFALSELGIGMSLTLNAFGKNSVKVFLDSTSPLFTRIDPSKVVEFLQDRIAKVKAENAMFFFTVGKGTIQENFLRRLEEMVDCVIELEVQKEKKKIVRRVQFKKLRGQKQPSFDIFVDTTDELTLPLLKNPNKNHK
jgi:KaiC/GvpD/RAD55 family RecA-like ATPase